MKYIKFLALNIVVFGTLFTLISLLFPSVIQTSKTLNIGGGENKILSSLSDTSTWKSWNMFSKTNTAVGIVMQVKSENAVISWGYDKGRKLDCEMIVYKAASDSIPVSFTITEKLKWYPWAKFRALVSDKAMNNAVELSLENLKKQIEAQR